MSHTQERTEILVGESGLDYLRGLHLLVVGLGGVGRSEEHTSELQSHNDLVCRLLFDKKK